MEGQGGTAHLEVELCGLPPPTHTQPQPQLVATCYCTGTTSPTVVQIITVHVYVCGVVFLCVHCLFVFSLCAGVFNFDGSSAFECTPACGRIAPGVCSAKCVCVCVRAREK